MTWENIPGWSLDIERFYRWLAKRLPKGAKHVECGAFCGRSAACLFDLRPDLEMWLVDPWLDTTHVGYRGTGEHTAIVQAYGGLFPAFLKLVEGHAPALFKAMHIHRGTLETLAFPFGTVDSIFIDGAHDYPNVVKDIDWAWRAVKRGGIIAGHDYNGNTDGHEVVKAVDELLGKDAVHLMPWPEPEDLPKLRPEQLAPDGWTPGFSSCWWVDR